MTAKPITLGPIALPGGTELYYTNADNASISPGAGSFLIVDVGDDGTITTGNGNETIFATRGDATITTGTGDQMILVGAKSTVTIGSNNGGTDQSLVAAGSGSTVNVADGKNIVIASGSHDSVSTGNGTDVIYALGGGNDAIALGNGHNWAYVAQCNNTIDQGSGTDVDWTSNDDNSFVMNAAGGTDFINGFNNGDQLDLSKILAGLNVTADLTTITPYVTLTEAQDTQFPGLMDSTLVIKGSGGTAIVTLMDYNAVGLQTMLSKGLLVTSPAAT